MFKTEIQKKLLDVEVAVGVCDICQGSLPRGFFKVTLAVQGEGPWSHIQTDRQPMDVCPDCVVDRGASIRLILDTKKESIGKGYPPEEKACESNRLWPVQKELKSS